MYHASYINDWEDQNNKNKTRRWVEAWAGGTRGTGCITGLSLEGKAVLTPNTVYQGA